MTTIKDVAKIIRDNNSFFLQQVSGLYDIFNTLGYYDDCDYIDFYFANQFRDLIVDEEVLIDGVEYASILDAIDCCLMSNKEQIKRLFEVQTAEYNPLDNVDRYELFDKQTVTNTNGKTKSTDTIDKVTDTLTSKVSGFDNNNLVTNAEDTTTSSGSGVNGKIVNTTENDAVTNTTETSGTAEDGKIFNHIHGNIGVTMSTQLLSNHASFWKAFNFYEVVFHLIFSYLSIGIYE